MPVFGQKARFAIEYTLGVEHGREWLFGRFCYWCKGMQIGDYESGTSLRDVLFELEGIARNAGRRTNPRFTGVPASQVFNLLDRALYGPEVNEYIEIANEEQWGRHTVIPGVDIFNEWKGFLVEEEQAARLIIAYLPTGKVQAFTLAPGEIDKTVKELILDLGALYDQYLKDEKQSFNS